MTDKAEQAMGAKTRVLILEDVPTDAELLQRELLKARGAFVAKWVDTREAFIAALENFSPDLILSDYTLPDIDGMTALRLVSERAPEVPVIIVTGSISEETAVECMKAGASDYVIKEHLVRLIPAVESALEMKQEREERRRAEERLRESEARFRAVAQAAPNAIVTADDSGNIFFWNDAAEAMFGYTQDEVKGRPLTILMPERYHEAHTRALERYTPTGASQIMRKTVELTGLRKDGREFPMEISRAAWNVGTSQFFTGVLQDITDRRALEEQLRQAQKLEAVGRLAGGVAHDFNNLLTVVLGESQMALQVLPDGHPLREPLQEVHDAGTRATGLTRQLLTFSRKQIVEPVVFNLNELINGVDKMLRRLIGEDVELITRTASDPVVVNADRGQIEQVVMNLAVNARDAMPRGGQLVIEVGNVTLGEDYARSHADAVAGNYALISVSDTGTGMTEEVKARLFEPFFTTKESDRGTGLGLPVCYGIAKQFGGHIGVYSEPGLGSTMRVYLPCAAESVEAPVETVAASPPRGSETILLVEDEKSVRRMGVRILRAQGYRVLEAGDCEQALQLLQGSEDQVQLLLCDVVLPRMGGRAVAERVRELDPDIKVLFVSGYTDDVILKNQLLERNVTLLQKPFTPSTLALKVRQVLDGESSGGRRPMTRPDLQEATDG